MADYYVDYDGNITTKKKKKEENKTQNTSSNPYKLPLSTGKSDEEIAAILSEYREGGNQFDVVESVKYNQNAKRAAALGKDVSDIAPVVVTKGEDTYFSSGTFRDGYQLGDVTLGAVSTVEDALLSGLEGIGHMGEGLFDLGTYLAAGAADLFGADEAAEDIKDFAKKNLTEEAFSDTRKDLGLYNNSFLGNKSRAIGEGIGQVGGMVITGGMGTLGGLGTVGNTVLTMGTMGLSSMGSGMSEAYNAGATDGEAFAYGATVGTIDAVSELIFAGLGKGIKALGFSKGLTSIDDVLAKKISNIAAKFITSDAGQRYVGNTLEWAVKSGAEGLEEVIAGLGSAAAKDLILLNKKDEKAYWDIVKDENLLEQFIVGSISSGIAQYGGRIKSIKNDTDFVTNLTKNEETVINKEYETRIAEAEKGGKTLSNKDKNKIFDDVKRDAEKGYISTDLIESILGGETYKGYQSALEQEKALKEEISALENTPKEQITVKQSERLTEAREELKNLDKETVKSRLDTEISDLLKGERRGKGSMLLESYNEQSRRGQAFTADLSKYDEKQRATIQKAIDSGILNNTNRAHEFVDIVSKISADKGVLFDFANNEKLKESGFAIEGKIVNGVITKDGVTLNIDSPKALQSTVGHEITHILEGTELYNELQTAIFEYAKTKKDFDGRLKDLTELYKDIEGADINKELTADLVGEYLFTDEKFVQHLSTSNRNVFQKIYDEIKYLIKVATAGTKEAKQLERVKKAFEDAYRQSGTAQSKTNPKYSVAEMYVQELSDEDIDRYYKTGKTGHVKNKKLRIKEAGGSAVLSSESEVSEFVRNSVKSSSSEIKGYATVPKALSEKILNATNGHTNPENWFLELSSDDLFHAFREHQKAKEPGDLDMSLDEFERLPMQVDGEAEILGIERYKDATSIKLGVKDSGGGDFVVVEMISSSNRALRMKNAWKVTAKKYKNLQNKKASSEHKWTSETPAPFDGKDLFEGIIPQSEEKVNTQISAFANNKANSGTKWSISGERSKTADTFNLAKAKTMLEQGVDSETIRQETNWFKSYDGKWRYEIDDSKAKWHLDTIEPIKNGFSSKRYKLGDLLEHEELYEAYPQLKDVAVWDTPVLSHGRGYIERGSTDNIVVGKMENDSTIKQVILHELQHIIQNIEGFAQGSSVSMFDPKEWGDKEYDALKKRNAVANELYDILRKNGVRISDGDIYSAQSHSPDYRASDEIIDRHYSTLQNLAEQDNRIQALLDEYDKQVQIIYPSTPEAQYYDTAGEIEAFDTINRMELSAEERKATRPNIDNPNAIVLGVAEDGDSATRLSKNEVSSTDDGLFDEANTDIRYSLSDNGLDNGQNFVYNDKRGDGYVRTDEFRKLQAESQRMSDEESKLYHSGSKQIDDEVRGRLSRTFGLELRSANSKRIYSIRTLLNPKTNNNVNIYEDVGGSLFHDCFEISRKYLRNGELVDLHEVKTTEYGIGYDDCDNYLSEDGLSGFSITPDGDLISVFNLNAEKGFLKTIAPIVKEKAKTLDCYASPNQNLMAMYEKIFGFKTASVMDYNMEYDHDDIAKNHNMPKVAFMVNTESDVETKYFAETKYDEAKAYRDSFVKQTTDNDIAPVQYSLSWEGKNRTLGGGYRFSGKDLLKSEQDIAPVAVGVANNATTNKTVEDIAPAVNNATYGEQEPMTAENPFNKRDIKTVGNRKVKAYMYENPEVKPYFQEEANVMLGELQNTTRGKRWYNDEVYYESGGKSGWSGTKRHTTDDIAYLLDELHYTYAEIEKGLKAIIEDNGAENNACSKRIEFLLNDRLLNGHTDIDGVEIPSNQEYVNLINGKNITEYNEKAFDNLVKNGDNLAPVAEDVKTANTADNIAPVIETEAKAEKPKTETKPKAEEQPKIAKVLTEEPTTTEKKFNPLKKAREKFFDKQAVIEDLAFKTGNRELMGKANYMLSAESRAQYLIGHGTDNVRSLTDINKKVMKSGKGEDFQNYLYHMLNIDRMSLETPENKAKREALAEKLKGYSEKQINAIAMEWIKRDTPEDAIERINNARDYIDALKGKNKPVFGDSVTADISRKKVKEYEAKNPEFKQWAQEVYNFNNHLRKLLVDNGVISQETADLWEKVYPHFVPIRRNGKNNSAINVPLDTNRTGVNAPIKRAKGGNSDILPLFNTMAERTRQTFSAIARNNFGLELMNTLNSVVETDSKATNIDETIDIAEKHEELLQEGKNGANPTFTVFENGKRVTFEITDELYSALKPTSEAAAYTNKVLNFATNVFRGLLTEYNPVFAAKNIIKDAQDVLFNSQHFVKTYTTIPRAIAEIASKGKYYKEYLANGGEQNTYFERDSKSFKKKKSAFVKVVGLPLNVIGGINNFIEKVPRLAEYIASRKSGASVEVAMLDSARVTTNFAAGGEWTKFLNRNGATFLNASVQGFNQNIRNIREAKVNGLKGWVKLAAKTALVGVAPAILNGLLWEDDEEYEELSDYVKDNYYVVAKTADGKFVRIPKGRTAAVIQDAFEQMNNLVTGDDETDFGNFFKLVVSNLAPNNPIDNNILAPIVQTMTNTSWYGEDIVPTRLQDVPKGEQYDESIDAISKWLGENIGISPYKFNYLLNQYSSGVGDVLLPMITPETSNGAETLGDYLTAPWADAFTTDSTMKNQNVSDFYDKANELTVNANSMYATDDDILKSKYMNSVNAELSELYKQKREIQNSDIPKTEKYDAVMDIQRQIDELAEEALNSYDSITSLKYEAHGTNLGEYASVGDKYFKVNKDGEWQKLDDDETAKFLATKDAGDSYYAKGEDGTEYKWYVSEDGKTKRWEKLSKDDIERQNEVTKGLGISPSKYWSNREEYGYAFDYPENYAVAKAVGGYESYREHSKIINSFESDKDKNGNPIKNSVKPKVVDYLNSLNIDYGEKIILFKKKYNADDTYNYEIINYLNSREDISYSEMETILKELGFNVDSKGKITW